MLLGTVAVTAVITTQLASSGLSAPPRHPGHALQADHDVLAEHMASDVRGPAHQTTVQTPLSTTTTSTTTTSTTTTTQPPPPPAPAPPPPPPPPPPPAAAPAPASGGPVPPVGHATAWGCAAAIAYVTAYAYPGFSVECPGNALGREGMTCKDEPGICTNQLVIAIADPCPVAYMNEASNSWVLMGASSAPLDPYGTC
jgi:hypothetical protein